MRTKTPQRTTIRTKKKSEPFHGPASPEFDDRNLLSSSPGERRLSENSDVRETRELAHQLKQNLLLLVKKDREIEAQGYKVGDILAGSAELLQRLKEKAPRDPDVYVLEKAYQDLKDDFEHHRETELDASFETLALEMRKEIEASGVRKVGMNHLEEIRSPSLHSTVDRLHELNIKPSYVVESTNPDAKTVVLFMQHHGNPHLDEKKLRNGTSSTMAGIKESEQFMDRAIRSMESSQSQIRDALIAATKAGLTSTVYEEGMPEKTALRDISKIPRDQIPPPLRKVFERILETGVGQAKTTLGDALQVKGYDVDALKDAVVKGETDFFYRLHAHNALIASNIAELVNAASDTVSFLTIGAEHEAYPNSKLQHHLPLSHALAYYGLNVVVVDATYDPPVS